MKRQVVVTVAVSVLEAFLFLGSVFGWPSLQPILIKEGFFSENCPLETTTNATAPQTSTATMMNVTTTQTTTESTTNVTAATIHETTEVICTPQIESLNLVFTIFTSLPCTFIIFYGLASDRYGNWICRTVLVCLFSAGSVMTAMATPERSWVLYLSFSLCCFSGLSLLINNLTVANLSPRYRASITTLISGAFDSSGIIYLGFYLLYSSAGWSFRTIFLAYAVLSMLFAVQTFFLQPKRTPPYDLPKNYKYGYKELPCFAEVDADDVALEDLNQNFQEENNDGDQKIDDAENPDNISLKQCLREIYTWTEILHHCVLMLSITYFIGSFNTWIVTKVEPSEVYTYIVAFGVIQGFGIFFAPLSGMLMDYFRQRYTKSIGLRLASFKSVTIQLFINDAIVITMFALSLIPNAKVQYITIVLQSIGRVFLFATAAAFCNAVYPSSRFGILYGITEAFGGLSCLLQYPITLLLTRVLNNNVSIVSGMLLLLCCCNLAHPLYLSWIIKSRAAERKLRETGKTDEENSEDENLVSQKET